MKEAQALDLRRLIQERGATLVMSCHGQLTVVERAASSTFWRAPTQLRRQLVSHIRSRGGDPRGNHLVEAMVTGQRARLDHSTVTQFRDAGVAHLLAVSGLHLAAMTVLVFLFARFLWAGLPGLALRVNPQLVAALTVLVLMGLA